MVKNKKKLKNQEFYKAILIDKNGFRKEIIIAEIKPHIYMADLPKLEMKMFFSQDNLNEFLDQPIVKEKFFKLDIQSSDYKKSILVYKEIL